ncbi:sigma-70 family RNA polymerase sigma factor [Paenibacillus elgii]|uniref:sigma-70 family RNA polymerase sigma factor n=1 Tax=Paenibacillus elgii TaxID=189691 RepID=UPI000248CB6C|nr:sigma-70 family RNA polymerase sigma factor [Paenibacillus elgii]
MRAFKRYCKTLTDGILERYWTDMTAFPKSDKELELFNQIVMEFLPKFNPARSRTLRAFLWRRVRDRVVRDWKREKYKNADRETAEPKAILLDEFARTLMPSVNVDDELTEREKVIKYGLIFAPHLSEMKPNVRREFFSRVIDAKLLRELQVTQRQREVLELLYDQDMKEVTVAELLGVKQPTINRIRKSAERALFKSLEKKFGTT